MPSTAQEVRAACSGASRPDANHGLPPAEILPGLTIGTKDSALDLALLDKLNVKTIVNVGVNKSNPGDGYYPGRTYVPIEVEDETGNVLDKLPAAFEAIDAAKAAGGAAFVHCAASVSRGVTFVIAYVMKANGLTAAEATKFVAAKWGATFPCDAFVEQLLAFEKQLGK